jgi:hypothetical protein
MNDGYARGQLEYSAIYDHLWSSLLEPAIGKTKSKD